MNADVEKLNAEIVKAAEAMVRAALGFDKHPMFAALESAVAAKRAAMKPKPLSADEARSIYRRVGLTEFADHDAMQAVLTACLERAYKVIEAIANNENAGSARAIIGGRPFVELDAVKSALDGRSA